MARGPKITIVGAGGYVFPIRLTVDILSFPELRSSTLHLYDIKQDRLDRSRELIRGIIKKNKLPTRLEAGTNRRQALEGADFVIIAFQVGGTDAYKFDVEIPRSFGLDQCVGDTLGPGGVFRGLRSIGALRRIAEDLRELSPGALILQYANPMAMNCWATSSLGVATVGLCHSVQGTTQMLARHLDLPYGEVSFRCAGINHQAWITEFKHKGRDVYPRLRKVMDRKFPSPFDKKSASLPPGTNFEQRGLEHRVDDEVYYYEKVRTEIMRSTGFFHTESSHHGSEYVPWFRKNKKIVDAYIRKRWDYYDISCSYKEGSHQDYLKKLCAGPLKLSEEYGARIIHSCVTDEKRVIYGNVPNTGMPRPGFSGARPLIVSNLPAQANVEVACLVDRNGVQPAVFGDLPPMCAAINRANIGVQELAVLGALSGDRTYVHQAVAMDQLTGALLTLPQIRSMVDKMFAAQARWLPDFSTKGGRRD